MDTTDIEAKLARHEANIANIARIEAMVADQLGAAARLDEMANSESDEFVIGTLLGGAASLRSQARGNEKWLVDLRGLRDRWAADGV